MSVVDLIKLCLVSATELSRLTFAESHKKLRNGRVQARLGVKVREREREQICKYGENEYVVVIIRQWVWEKVMCA